MQLELANYDRTATFSDISRTIFIAAERQFHVVGVLPTFVVDAVSFNSQLKIATPVDYPLGGEVTNVRLNAINEAYKRGAKVIDLVLNHSFIYDKKFKAICDDWVAAKILCDTKELELRAMFDYRLFEMVDIIELCKKIKSVGVKFIINSTAYTLDDPTDNILSAKEITKNTQIKVIANSKFNNILHFNNCLGLKIFGMRFNSTNVVEKLFKDSKNGV